MWKMLVLWAACVAVSLPIHMSTGAGDRSGGKLRIHVLDVGQADCIVIETPKGRLMVVDVGEDKDRAGKEAKVLHKYLKENIHRYTIDYLLITHYHEDHMGWPRKVSPTGLAYLLRLADIKVKKVIDRGLEIQSRSRLFEVYGKWIKGAGVKRETIRFRPTAPGEHRQIDLGDDISIDVIAFNGSPYRSKLPGSMVIPDPEAQRKSSEHNFSIVFVLHYRDFDMYFGGDVCGYDRAPYDDIESHFIGRLKDVEVVKVSDHGSVWGTRGELLEALSPEVSIISCGRRLGFPARSTVKKLVSYRDNRTGKPRGSDVYQTGGEDGAELLRPFPDTGKVQTITGAPIVIETDGKDSFWIRYKDVEQEYLLDEQDAYRSD
jgi:competence protein ComEC